jgi:pimeloyl-ACP methyl ester carboxylesterase
MGEPRTTHHRTAPKLPIRVQFAHGLESSAHGTKARILAEHFDAITPEMDTADFEGCVAVHAAALRGFRPEVLVGSSFGGAVAVELLVRGLWRGPTLLLAQAAVRRGGEARLPEGVAVWLVHGLRDETIDPEDSRRLAATGTPHRVRLIEVDDDHRLSHSVARGRLVEWVRNLADWRSEPPPDAEVRLKNPSG